MKDKTEEVVELMKEKSVDIIGLCETWMRGSGQFKVHDDYKLLYTRATKAKYGVAFLVKPDLANNITLVKHVSERMMGLTIKLGDKHVGMVMVYTPQQGRPDDEKERFYTMLQDLIDEMPHQESLLILGDLNGHVGSDRSGLDTVIGAFGIGDRNNEGQKIIDFCVANQLAVMNTFFKHHVSHKWTWYRWNSTMQDYTDKSMIDLVLAGQKRLIADVKAVPSVSVTGQ